MAENRHRNTLGKFDYENGTPYDFAVVLVDFMNSPNTVDRHSYVEEAIKRWTEAKVTKAQPELSRKLAFVKDGLESVKAHINGILFREQHEVGVPKDGG